MAGDLAFAISFRLYQPPIFVSRAIPKKREAGEIGDASLSAGNDHEGRKQRT